MAQNLEKSRPGAPKGRKCRCDPSMIRAFRAQRGPYIEGIEGLKLEQSNGQCEFLCFLYLWVCLWTCLIWAQSYIKKSSFLNMKMTGTNVGAQFGSATAASACRAEPFNSMAFHGSLLGGNDLYFQCVLSGPFILLGL